MAVTVPDWADTLLDLIGVSWPNVDEDAYRDMADSLRGFADDLEDDGQLANGHVERLLSSGYGEAMDALNLHWGKVKGTHLKDIASAARTIAGALDTAATAIEGMKGAAVVQLGYLASEAGIALSLIPVTGGLSALLGAGAIRATQEAVRRLIKECMEEAVGYIVAALTEPAVAALENLAADLVVQLGASALGLQDGVDLGQAQQAGKDGFKDGVQGAKDAMQLASADGPGGGSGGGGGRGAAGKGFHIEHSEHDHASTQLSGLSVNFHTKTAGRLSTAKSHHSRTRGRDSIAQAIDPVADKAIDALEKALKTMGDHVTTKLPKAVKQVSTDHRNTDLDIRSTFARDHRKKDGGDLGGDAGGGRKGGAEDGGGTSSRAKPDALRDAKDAPRRNGVSLDKTVCKNDPIDVATGEMLLPETDLTLPGALPLVLRRTHLSEYRHGHWFGRSWASTLDERIELDRVGGGALWAREDGSVLVYPRLPRPEDPEPVYPEEGPRLALTYGGEDNSATTYLVTDPHTGVTRSFTGSPYHASSAHWLTEIEDRNQHRITFARRPDGTPTSVAHSGGYLATLTTADARIRELALRTPDGPVTVLRYGYDAPGNLTEVINSSGLPLRFTYDPDARITSWTDRNGSTFRYVYDADGRVVRTIGPDGCLSSVFAYDTHPETGDPITRYTDSTGATTVHYLNRHLQVVAETDPLGRTTHQTWDRYDRLLSRTDPLGRTTTYTYDDGGDLTAVAHPDGTTATVTYNDLHQITSVTGPDGATWRQEYDDRGNPTAFTRPDGTTTRLTHDARGHLTGVDDALGALDRLRCDPAGLPLAVRGPMGTVTRYTRDAFGRPIRITGPDGGTTELEWTVEGKLARRTDPDGSTQSWRYDGEGNCLLHRDATGGETRFEYTHFDLLAARTTPDGARHAFTHDTELRISRVTNPQGLTWSYTYDPAGHLTAETDFDGRTLAYTHDALGRLATRTNGLGQTIRYARDAAGRVVTKDADGALTHFTYDALGRLSRATGPDADLSYVRDDAGRILRETCNGRALTHAYDASGRRVRRTTPTGAVATWTYPADRRALLDTSGHRVVFEFDAMGRETTRRIDDTLTIDHGYDALGRLTDQLVRGPGDATVQHRAYTYRPGGHLTAVDDHLRGHRLLELTREGRVTAVTADNWSEAYAYDEAGNQTEAVWPRDGGAAGPREYTGTRITRAGGIRYEHDAQGRVTLRQKRRLSHKPDTWRYAWDAEDRLTSVTTPDGTRWRYLYDPLGRRTAKLRLADDGTTVAERVDFTWDGDTLCEQSTHAAGTPETTVLTWDHDGLTPVAQTERKVDLTQHEIDRRFFTIVTDLVGTPRELIDERGEVAWHTRATLWGTTSWNRTATGYTPLRFPGQYFDPESGLHYNRHRHYDPDAARYLTPDPLGLTPAPNPYTYVDNPLLWVDPLGLAGCPHRSNGEQRHSVVLGVNRPGGHSESLAEHLRKNGDPGAHTYNGDDYAGVEPGGPVWMTNVLAAIGDRNTTLSVTLDGMPNRAGDKGLWNTPESIVEAFQVAVAHGDNFSLGSPHKWPDPGNGTAWEMSSLAKAVRDHEIAVKYGDPPDGRPWEDIHWYSNNERVHIPKPDILEIDPHYHQKKGKTG
ncbi:RHS repeat-associated core domain-containing protein [Streptomyces botrytidirepellens]|nr:RHS repeat-associated core domain-containing protein [Streptomyces botrytidirepellens]